MWADEDCAIDTCTVNESPEGASTDSYGGDWVLDVVDKGKVGILEVTDARVVDSEVGSEDEGMNEACPVVGDS